MGKEVVAVVAIVVTAFIIGLVLRFGNTSIPLGADVTNVIDTGFQSLTLANPNTYPYEGPHVS